MERARVVPVKLCAVSVAKYEVRLQEKALRAVHAQQTMLTRMVLFNCDWCNERFPTFHPAYRTRPSRWSCS